MRQPIPFAVGSNAGRSTATNERLINMYGTPNPKGAVSPFTLYGTPGLVEWTTIGEGPVRGMLVLGSSLFVVVDEDLYLIAANKTVTHVGTIPGAGPVRMDTNGVEVVIVAAASTHVATVASVVTVPDVDAIDVVAQDGYAIYVLRNGAQFVISGINNASAVDPLDFATAASEADDLVAIRSLSRELWMFGETSIECWYNSGDPVFPFARNAAGVINRGCLAPASPVVIGSQVLWLGDDGVVYINSGYVPQRISTHAVEYAIGNYTLAQQRAGRGCTYAQEGHIFYVLSFPEGTWVYDLTTGLWHERRSYSETRWRVTDVCAAFGKLLASDFETNKIYELDLDSMTDDGEVIQRIIYTQTIGDGANRYSMHDFQLLVDAGVGLATGQGSDPQVILEWSDDGGRTWSNQYWQSIGVIGQYEHRTRWTRLGSFRQRTMRLTFTDPVKYIVHGAFADIEARNS